MTLTEPFASSADAGEVTHEPKPESALGEIDHTEFRPSDVEGLALSAPAGGGAPDATDLTVDDESTEGPAIVPPMHEAIEPQLQAAHELLLNAVNELNRRGNLPAAAGIKPEMQKLSKGQFSEAALNFVGFRAFLNDAQRRGVIILTKAPAGPDVLVSIPGGEVRSGSGSGPSTSRSSERKVRQNVWSAFVAFDPNLRRMYDHKIGDIRVLQTDGESVENVETALLLKEIDDQPERFIEIDPIPREQQLEWMADFASTLDDVAVGATLLDALQSDRPLAEFARAVRSRQGVSALWHTRLTDQVKAVINEWVASHQVTLTIEDQVSSSRPRSGQPSAASRSPRSQPARQTHLDDLRASILSIIADLPTEELMQIKVPVVYLFKR